MPRQRTSMTVADVRRMLREQGLTRDNTAITRQQAQAEANLSQDTEASQRPTEADAQGSSRRVDSTSDSRAQPETRRAGVTQTQALQEAQADADGPVTVVEDGNVSTVPTEAQADAEDTGRGKTKRG